jgi:hypothetical protein
MPQGVGSARLLPWSEDLIPISFLKTEFSVATLRLARDMSTEPFFLNPWGELCTLDAPATSGPTVPAPGDRWVRNIGGMRIGRGNGSALRKTSPVPLCPPQILHDVTWDSNPSRLSGKQETDRLRYGTAERLGYNRPRPVSFTFSPIHCLHSYVTIR